MSRTNVTILGPGSYAVTAPSVILVFDFHDEQEGPLSQLLSAHPGMPVVFVCSGHFTRTIFSLAENRNRTFVLSTDIPATEVPEGSPVQWLKPGLLIPDMPGDVIVSY